jgi:hypothetical protein
MEARVIGCAGRTGAKPKIADDSMPAVAASSRTIRHAASAEAGHDVHVPPTHLSQAQWEANFAQCLQLLKSEKDEAR